ncbi:MAG: LLM class flavin-dependent oxidoreductase [Chloroflexi bacterium]|nr:LLM class flavin-dependent oxidoreductase [Chloroflexota bacterium]MCC6892622.1 LLM class flavin-dependent oxidoreductase [Anaerolineae bacterium]
MHYGHTLQFGTFVTPSNKAPEAVVALARHSESLGYDLVTFQDHPYQSAFLDTWTLMSWVAGQTERIHIAANVLNVPLRQPAVLGRSAASLDLLSGGRLAMALGAGAFWDGIAAMGGKRLEPAQAVDALDETIDIIRGMLDTSETLPLRYYGDHYRLKDVQRGPIPAHNIPIWLGALKPKMLRLIGQKADGWLPSYSYMKPGDLEKGSRIIDEAAVEAGRDPREIRRLLNISGQFAAQRGGFLNGTSQNWVDDLLPLVVEQGIGTFILMADDTKLMEQFAGEVVPALREAVNHEIPEPTLVAMRSSAARAKRREGIQYDSVPASLANSVIEPGDVQYGRVKSTYMRAGSPGIVIQPKNVDEVVEALTFARQHPNVALSVRSGGHGISGRSTNRNGIVIDLARLNKIEVLDEATRRVRIQPAARWMDVALALEPYGWALSSGDYGGVGVGGLATAGGVGWLVRDHGLTIDHLKAVEMVLADGSVVRASDDENPDLFWAVRGAGANFGIVVSFEFEVDEVGPVGWAQLVMDASRTASFLEGWGEAVETAPRDLTSFLIMGQPRGGQPMVAHVLSMVNSDQPEVIIDRIQRIADVAPLYDQSVVITSYANVMANASREDHDGQGEPSSRSGLIEHITREFAAAAERLIRSGAVYFFQIRSVGGAVSDVGADATAYAGRSANFSVAAIGANRERLNAQWDKDMAPHFNGVYLSFDSDQRPERIHDAFPPKTLSRLQDLKLKYDPQNVFRDNFNVAPQRVAEAAP